MPEPAALATIPAWAQGPMLFLARDAASFVHGEVLVVDGGYLASGVNQ
jgi:NAD(P)-dependent dehydrogenase (short-subunit alcohol dehydrogenase family)